MQITITNEAGRTWNGEIDRVTKEMLTPGGKLRIAASVPVAEITGVWHPDCLTIQPMRLPWSLRLASGASRAFPFAAFLDQKSDVVCAIGLGDGVDDCLVTVDLNQERCCYEVVFTLAAAEETIPFAIFTDVSHRTLGEVLRDYRVLLMPKRPDYPEAAWLPVYCTWYAVHAALDLEYLRSNAKIAAALGFGTFIVDDGWCVEEDKRVTPQTLPDWYRDIGDWKLASKLAGMADAVREAHALGLRYLFWVAPFFAGRRSALNARATRFLTELHEGQRIYDPEDAAAAAETMESIYRIFRELDLDGIKIDFVDAVPPDPERPRCRAVKRYLETLIGRIRADKPEALIEFRQRYATPTNAALATAFRAADVPFDYLENFSRCVQLRLLLGDGIPIHADPVYFDPGESVEAVGRHMIATLAGVPMLSMELRTLSEAHRRVIENYIEFYRHHRQTLNFGHWTVKMHNGFAAWVRCEDEQRSVVILTDPFRLAEAVGDASGPVAVLNLTAERLTLPGARAFDAQGTPCGEVAPSGGRLERDSAHQ